MNAQQAAAAAAEASAHLPKQSLGYGRIQVTGVARRILVALLNGRRHGPTLNNLRLLQAHRTSQASKTPTKRQSKPRVPPLLYWL